MMPSNAGALHRKNAGRLQIKNDFHDQTENYCRDIQDFTLETHRVLVVELDDAGTLQ